MCVHIIHTIENTLYIWLYTCYLKHLALPSPETMYPFLLWYLGGLQGTAKEEQKPGSAGLVKQPLICSSCWGRKVGLQSGEWTSQDNFMDFLSLFLDILHILYRILTSFFLDAKRQKYFFCKTSRSRCDLGLPVFGWWLGSGLRNWLKIDLRSMMITLLETKSSPLKIGKLPKGNSSSNHPFSGASCKF